MTVANLKKYVTMSIIPYLKNEKKKSDLHT